MFRRIVIFLASLLFLLNSALVNASIGGWTLSNPTAVGASILYDGTKGSRTSSVLISPNASQVAKVLRGGIAGIALTLAIKQLLGAVDLVMDSANNEIKYTKIKDGTGSYYVIDDVKYYTPNVESACSAYASKVNDYFDYALGPTTCAFRKGSKYYGPVYYISVGVVVGEPVKEQKTLSLITVAQKVIENAESDNLDAQFAVLAAATNILSEAEQDDAKAKPIEDELERNADDKCRIHNAYMNGQARIVEDRYNEMRVDPLFLYRDYRTTPHPNGYGSWNGHQLRYTYEQGLLNQKILDAFFAGCPETTKATEWKNKPAPQKPDYAM